LRKLSTKLWEGGLFGALCSSEARGLMSCCGGSVSEERKLAIVSRSPFFVYLDDSELRVLVQAFEYRRIGVGKRLPDSPFYFVLQGAVEVRKDGITLVHKQTGSFFSRFAGVTDNIAKSAKPATSRFSVARRMSNVARNSIMTSKDAARRVSKGERKGKEAPTEIVATQPSELLLLSVTKLEALTQTSKPLASVVSTLGHDNLEMHLSKVPFIQRAMLTPQQLRTLGELGLHIAQVRPSPALTVSALCALACLHVMMV
jgi:hypothetical protein